MLAGCGSSSSGGSASPGQIAAVGAENEYANVIAQIGGRYVKVSAIESNPNTDPHTFEASPSVAQEVGQAKLIVQNGVGYDTYMEKIESASPSSARKVIDVQKLLGLPESTPNPHLWYKPTTMPAVATALASDLRAAARARRLFSGQRAGIRSVAATVAAGAASVQPTLPGHHRRDNRAGRRLHARSGRDQEPDAVPDAGGHHERHRPSPQDVTLQNSLFANHQVKVFVYNQQVTDSVTEGFLKEAGSRRGAGRRGIRDDAHSRLRLPVVDDGRDARARKGRVTETLHPKTVSLRARATRLTRASDGAPAEPGAAGDSVRMVTPGQIESRSSRSNTSTCNSAPARCSTTCL